MRVQRLGLLTMYLTHNTHILPCLTLYITTHHPLILGTIVYCLVDSDCFFLVIETRRIFIYMCTWLIFMYVVDLHHFHLFGQALCLRVAGIGMA